jgi:hypothetical protein
MARTVVVAAALLAAAGLAHADEAKTPVSASMILDIVAAPVQDRRSAFDEALRRPPPPAADAAAGEVLPDGSVRSGRTVITVKNPCPPGLGGPSLRRGRATSQSDHSSLPRIRTLLGNPRRPGLSIGR